MINAGKSQKRGTPGHPGMPLPCLDTSVSRTDTTIAQALLVATLSLQFVFGRNLGGPILPNTETDTVSIF